MLSILSPLFVMAALVQTAPAPVATEVPEIGRVQSQSVCRRIAENASQTAESSLRNDENIQREITLFRGTKPGMFTSRLAKANWEKLATHFATEMYHDIKVSRVRLDELRDIAAKLPDSEIKDETNAYVDALDKSQGDQAKISKRILVALILADGRALAKAPAAAEGGALSPKGSSGTEAVAALTERSNEEIVEAKTRSNAFTATADLLQNELHDIIATENIAAAHAPKLLSACNHPIPTPEPSP